MLTKLVACAQNNVTRFMLWDNKRKVFSKSAKPTFTLFNTKRAMSKPSSNLPVACTLSEAELQKRRVQVLQKLKKHVQQQKEHPDGYALRFAPDDQRLADVMQLIQLERTCCAFLTIKLTVEPNHGSFWLELTGPAGTKNFIREKMGLAS